MFEDTYLSAKGIIDILKDYPEREEVVFKVVTKRGKVKRCRYKAVSYCPSYTETRLLFYIEEV